MDSQQKNPLSQVTATKQPSPVPTSKKADSKATGNRQGTSDNQILVVSDANSLEIKSQNVIFLEDGRHFGSDIKSTSGEQLKTHDDGKAASQDKGDYMGDFEDKGSKYHKVRSQNAASQVKFSNNSNDVIMASRQNVVNSQVLTVN